MLKEMPAVGIVGYDGREMTRAFLRMSQGAASCYHITDRQPLAPKINVLVATEASPVITAILPQLGSDDFLIVNADDRAIFPLLSQSKARLITYGFNNRACITASSVTNDGVQVCIQRGFTGIDGAEREPREFAARSSLGEDSMSILGAAAAWVVLNTN
ncbi:MAG: hypothetical protein FWB96_03460 [Defluviitaleaceae bacterium]|nr:hypothetical protein [Defluviitaleaceae bacterium]MCL2261737.1 hypothetical protein [Defluviitaleaceae bacterium]